MKSITSILAALALGTTLATAADEKPAAPAAGGDAKPAAGADAKPKRDPAESFKKLDTNGDGKLTLEEFLAGPQGKKDPEKAKAYFQKIDKDNTGSITLEQWVAAHSGGKKK
jgi:Ca2+-binding EF-hand superfamily protein